jgi:hypothetical protein
VTNTMILTLASNLPIRMGDLFPADSYTYTVRTDDGWNFILNAPLSPTTAISGTGVVAEFPFYAQTVGCVRLDFDTHLLVNRAAQPVDHQVIPGPISNPHQDGFISLVHNKERPTAIRNERVQHFALIPRGNGNVMLRVVGISEGIYAVGTRIGLTERTVVSAAELQDGFTDGFLRWQQEGDKLYIVAAPRKGTAVTRDMDIVLVHITTGDASRA